MPTDSKQSSKQSAFGKLPDTPDFPKMEQDILGFWDAIDAFHESNRRRTGRPFVFYDGPPFATGTPHYGHLLAGTLKDIVPRYWNMRGSPVERRFGWDCHGLPIEALAQKALGLAGASAIRESGVDRFNEQCRAMVTTYVDQWRATVTRMGRWVDFDDDYKTMDCDFMESVWWLFKQLFDQGRVYRAHRVMYYSPKLATPLAKNEVKDDNYQEVDDPAITVRFRMLETPGLDVDATVYLLAWTTTPWTLPENLALCVGPTISYAALRDRSDGNVYLLAENLIERYFKDEADYELLDTLPGSALLDWRYQPLLSYFADTAGAFRVLGDAFVSTGEGTGIVHMAPAYGEDDYRICRAAGIPLVDPLDDECRFTDRIPELSGRFCKDADKTIIKRLKKDGSLVHQANYRHSYPFCERTDYPLIYRAIDAWFVRVEDLRERLVAANDRIRWVPDFVGGKRFGNWLAGAIDWNVSRNRFWGSCIPIWVNEDDPDDVFCIGSIAELEELSGTHVDDLHKHIVDEIVIDRDGKRYRRTPEVLDCWFESGAMPYAQQHYPFENEDRLSDFFPADFIAEGLDQTRGWFYTLLVLGVALFDESPYRNVVVNGIVLAEDGNKMSKSKQNYPDPVSVLDCYGADALRAYLIDSPLVRGEPLRFSEKGLKEILRTVVLPYWNALDFFTTYAGVDGFDPRSWEAPPLAKRPEIDRWILSVLQSLVRDVNHEMEAYRLYNVVPRLVGFIDDLTNWYVRSSRRRFWKSDDDDDKHAAYATLYQVLVSFAEVLAPFMPFITEEVYQRLVRSVDEQAPESVHWRDYPQVDADSIDAELEQRMALVRRVVALGRKLREEQRLKVRQPLRRLTIVHRDAEVRGSAESGATRIAGELNVKTVTIEADESAFCTVQVKPNFQTLRQRCPQKIKLIAPALRDWGFAEVARLEAGEHIELAGEQLGIDDVLLQRQAREGAAIATDGEITVVLDSDVDEELAREGLAREFTSLVQNARKDAGLDVTDRIVLRWSSASEQAATALREHAANIATEVLAVDFSEGGVEAQPVDVNGEAVCFAIDKAQR